MARIIIAAVALVGVLLLAGGLVAGNGWLIGVALLLLIAAAAIVWRIVRRSRRRAESDDESEEIAAEAEERLEESHEPAADAESLAERMLREERYALLLRPQIAVSLPPALAEKAEAMMEEQMALVPEGDVFLCQPDERDAEEQPLHSSGRVVRVEAALLDRYLVTNRQFKRFVDGGGYEEMALWDEEIWQGVFDFVDATGHPGPRYWKHGQFPRGEADHPVVGVSWFEAEAYARWVGKRLPTDAEWVKAACWPMPVNRGLPSQRRYPWGDAWKPDFANIWSSGLGHTCPVTKFADGATVAGVYQMIGNVWEWTGDPFGLWHSWARRDCAAGTLRSLRGGAFDTYFESQATCHFQSGDSPLSRKHNIGFRCALGLCDLKADRLRDEDEELEEDDMATTALVGEDV